MYFCLFVGYAEYLFRRHCGLQGFAGWAESEGCQQFDIRFGRSIIVGLPHSQTFASAAVHLAALTLAEADSSLSVSLLVCCGRPPSALPPCPAATVRGLQLSRCRLWLAFSRHLFPADGGSGEGPLMGKVIFAG